MLATTLYLLIILILWTDIVYGQIGITTCTFATQTLCPTNIPLSYCDVAVGRCKCATLAGYIDDGTGLACNYDCGTLTAPTNGEVSATTGTTTGKIATYSCNNGYKLVGLSTRTCIQDTGWSGAAPTCTQGVIGDSCASNTNLCILIPHGTCAASTCQCLAGYENDGTNTKCQDLNDCTVNNCFNGATCVDGINNYTCTCAPGYNGTFCTNDINECIPSPCLNRATCIDGINDYTCICVAGYTGKTCATDINECASIPCQHGGRCNDKVNGYTCDCIIGYTGINCATDINECASFPCQNGGTCTDLVNNYLCACMAGYTDTQCQTNHNDCTVNNCLNGATCVDGINNYTCTCAPGYNGTFCTYDIDECILFPCVNGGICADGINGFTCYCVAGYTGKTCATNINDCIGHLCQNGATCLDGINQYTCTCVAGYDGTFCGNDINECVSATCQNGGICNDEINAYTCTCAAGYAGTTCAEDINECASIPCQHGGTCNDYVNRYTCDCVPGYTGITCAAYFDVCLSSQCQNGATCLELINNYSCACVPGFTDKNCQTNINDCAVNNCSNGSTCVDGINNYTCSCAPGYNGTLCTTNIDECFPVPCVNGGTCIDGINDYSCNCVTGYTGKTCDTRNWPKICNENVDERGTVWPETLAGNTLFKSCPETFTGNISRVCSSDAEWIVPKYTCLRSTVLNATKKVFGLSTQSTDVEIVGAVKQLLEAAKQATTSDVFSRAMDAEVFELTTALNFVAELVPADSLAATNDFIDSASSLVDQQHLNSWKTLEYWDSFGADNVIGAVEKVANKSKLIDHSIVTTNIAYKKQNTTIKDVSFPGESDGGWLEYSRSSIYVSFSSTLDTSEEVTSFGLIYKNLTGILRASGNAVIGEDADIVNGPVVSLTLVSPPTTPVTQVTVVIEHSVKTGYSKPRCSFWKFGKDNARGSWSMEGCVVASSNATVTVCTCDHLTNFAVLMSPFVQVDMTSEILRVASIVGMCISLLFLLITLLTHCCLYRYLRSDRVTHLINFCTALFVSYVIFLTGIEKTESRAICIFITSVLHYIYLVVFFLMLVGGIDVCYSVTFIFSKRLRMRCLLLAAWVLPAVIVGISLGITKTKGYGNSSFCWLSLEEGLIWAFVGPALTVIALNVLFLAITIYKLFQARTMKEKSKLDQIKTTVRALCVLVPVMGISWIVGIFYVHKELYWIQFVFAICNSLQGIFVFLFHCAFNTQVKNAMKTKARKYSSSKMTSELKLSQRNNSGPSSRTNLREPSNDDFRSQPVGQKRCLPHRHHKY